MSAEATFKILQTLLETGMSFEVLNSVLKNMEVNEVELVQPWEKVPNIELSEGVRGLWKRKRIRIEGEQLIDDMTVFIHSAHGIGHCLHARDKMDGPANELYTWTGGPSVMTDGTLPLRLKMVDDLLIKEGRFNYYFLEEDTKEDSSEPSTKAQRLWAKGLTIL